MMERVPFLALVPGPDAADVRAAIDRVVSRGWFVLGPELSAFEEALAAALGVGRAVGVGSGTDAIALTLRALGIGRGDEVITSPLSAAFSALAVQMAGATPVFADIDPARLTMDPRAAAAAITPRTAAVLPVHLYGQPADLPAFEQLAARHGLALVEDACQAHGATGAGRPVGTFGAAGALSFYPTKNLGALGDGGAVITNDANLAERLKRLRNGGQTDRYHHAEFGVNSRLDEIQAAILRARLPRLPAWTARRREIAARYRHRLADAFSPDCRPSIDARGALSEVEPRGPSAGCPVVVPPECDSGHVYHLFPIRCADRAHLQAALAAHGIETLIHYPVPIPQQQAFASLAAAPCPVADRVCGEICSLPLHPLLEDAVVDRVADAVRSVSSFSSSSRPSS
jgi:dTDP-3-amino-3,4,6-trideoxy-alpha-D-glucose transaminase